MKIHILRWYEPEMAIWHIGMVSTDLRKIQVYDMNLGFMQGFETVVDVYEDGEELANIS